MNEFLTLNVSLLAYDEIVVQQHKKYNT